MCTNLFTILCYVVVCQVSGRRFSCFSKLLTIRLWRLILTKWNVFSPLCIWVGASAVVYRRSTDETYCQSSHHEQHQHYGRWRTNRRIVYGTVRTLGAAANLADIEQIRRQGVENGFVEALCGCFEMIYILVPRMF